MAVSLAIEITQTSISLAVNFPYRVFDVDDLMLNTIGAAIGWAGWRAMFAQRHTPLPANAPD